MNSLEIALRITHLESHTIKTSRTHKDGHPHHRNDPHQKWPILNTSTAKEHSVEMNLYLNNPRFQANLHTEKYVNGKPAKACACETSPSTNQPATKQPTT